MYEQQKEEQINATRPEASQKVNTIKYAAQKFQKEYMFVCKALFEHDSSQDEG